MSVKGEIKSRVIEVNDLVKRYRKSTVNAVDGVNFYVEEGAFFALLGPNGAGKTTIVSILTTVLSQTSGSVSVAGYDLETKASKVREKIGVIFQNPSLDANLTAEENVRFHANLYGLFPFRPSFSLMSESYKRRVKGLASVLGIEKALHKPVKTLSGGMKRKLEIVRSLMHNPKILFLDEPTTGLDPVSRMNLWNYLQEIRESEKMTIFLTTHYLEEAEGADYLVVINNGKLVARGTPNEIKDVLVEKYLMVDAENREKLLLELTKKKIRFSVNKHIRIKLSKQSPQEVINQIKTKLSLLQIYNPSLEEAYIRIIEGGGKNARN
ncbi:ABC transporter ATP-binding protein [Candidatus Woesebacteria bacterium RIFOXYB1_FULL_38_16]|uniref:ABC transporter ATP-binding protein n=1 Tax=Candidatus Woesebacteria bacterium RIFOXYB1_FULL_38_16 TaxID=1802538 RepID=A0A1F8CVW4_9BACT|nr:MAG: ABC transporter ATP-binding protein [Candidatus Woesebacteria bacterium RIFOXYA1_FULL_38_9]OGM79959.1 MAG: ABC transporter ATP-binding protein [Candidatus Woesebacteria bacterium RIFOXYB1_FULL_38_16]